MEDVEGVGEADREVFQSYRCTTISRGVPHPGDIAEPASLSAVALPLSNYPLWSAIPEHIVDDGRLSQLQLEGVLYACTKHLEWLPSGERAGFFVADGAGVGKGRQVAGIIIDNYARGRRRHVWLSISTDLYLDACRDFRDLGCHINIINNCQTLDKESKALGLSKDYQEGVLFMTYSTLTSMYRGKSRLQQVIDWLGGDAFDGAIIFDESHKAKHFAPGKEAQSTKVASCVIELQQRLPRARIVYCSATGISEVANMAYMPRLGLWGPGTAFTGFDSFLDTMRKRGMSFLEMLAIELKSEGLYVARGLSFGSAEFTELKCRLTAEQTAVYNGAVALWQDIAGSLRAAVARTGNGKDAFKAYWAAQQRFFKLLCVSAKMDSIVAAAQQGLATGHAIVIGLQSTGEAATDALGLEPDSPCGWVSTLRGILENLVSTHFPVNYNHSQPGDVLPLPGQLHDPESVSERTRLLQRIQHVTLPNNFLDEVIERLGGPGKVAEMTGRKGRVVRTRDGSIKYQLRAKPDSSEMDSLNIAERDAFQKGNKVVAIISDAASTGISLHASLTAANQRRRMHFTIELPWSADKAIQQLGRTHRSNQASAPLYVLSVTNLGGEKRFAAAVARRLQSLGALTRGDRQAASGLDLSEYNLDSPLGRKALRVMYDAIVIESPCFPPGVTLAALLDGCDLDDVADIINVPDSGKLRVEELAMLCVQVHGKLRGYAALMGIGLSGGGGGRIDTVAEDTVPLMLAAEPGKGSKRGELGDVKRFLNRILGLPVACQNLLFNYFMATLTSEIKQAKAEGRFVDGVSDLPGRDIKRCGPPQAIWVDQLSHTTTYRNDISLDRGLSFEAALAKLEHERNGQTDRSSFRISKRTIFGRHQVVLAIQRPGRPNVFSVHRPNTGLAAFDMDLEELNSKYKAVAPEDVEELWTSTFETSTTLCMHGEGCTAGSDCQVGRRLQEVTVLSGSIVRAWGALETVLERNVHVLSRIERAMRVVRVNFDDGTHIVGVRYPPALIPEVQVTLQSQQMLLQTNLIAAQLQGKLPVNNALGGGVGRVAKEAPTPVDPASKAKAFRKPVRITDMFKRKAPSATAAATKASTPLAPGAGKKASEVVDLSQPDSEPQSSTMVDLDVEELVCEPIQQDSAKRGKLATASDGQMASCLAACDGSGGQVVGGRSSRGGEALGVLNGCTDNVQHKVRSPSGMQVAYIAACTEKQGGAARLTSSAGPINVLRTGSAAPENGMPHTHRAAPASLSKGIGVDRLLVSEDASKVALLVGMGFAQQLAVKALRLTKNDIAMAANYCATHS